MFAHGEIAFRKQQFVSMTSVAYSRHVFSDVDANFIYLFFSGADDISAEKNTTVIGPPLQNGVNGAAGGSGAQQLSPNGGGDFSGFSTEELAAAAAASNGGASNSANGDLSSNHHHNHDLKGTPRSKMGNGVSSSNAVGNGGDFEYMEKMSEGAEEARGGKKSAAVKGKGGKLEPGKLSKEEMVTKLEGDLKRLKTDLQQSRNKENDLRDQIISYMSSTCFISLP